MTKGLYARFSALSVIIVIFAASTLAVSLQAAPPPPPGGLGPTLDLHAGWNMISSPIGFVSVSSLQGNCSITDGPWWWDGTQYQTASTIEPGTGYWIQVASACTMQAIGRRSTTARMMFLQDGWNMISSTIPWVAMNRAGPNPLGNCRLESGLWWWDGQQYERVHPDEGLDNFKGYWVKVFGGCDVTSQSMRHTRDDLPLPPGPPAKPRHLGFFADLLKLLGFTQGTMPSARPLALQEIHLISAHASQIELHIQGIGIARSELHLYSLSGQLLAEAQGSGSTLRVTALGHDGQPWPNGVYLYVITVYGYDGQAVHSEARKLVLLR